MTRSGWNGLTMKSFAPALIDSRTLLSCPRAEHMITRAPGSSATISLRAARPSFSGIVMSRVVTSGLSDCHCSTASMPFDASPTTSWPPLAMASDTTFRMKTASSTTSIRAMFLLLSCSVGSDGDETFDADRPVGLVDQHEPAASEGHSVHVQVHRIGGPLVERNDRSVGHVNHAGGGDLRPPDLSGDAQRGGLQPLGPLRVDGVGRAARRTELD